MNIPTDIPIIGERFVGLANTAVPQLLRRFPMRKLARIHTAGALALLAALGAPASNLEAMTVSPLVVDLVTTGRGMNQVISVENTSAAALPVELSVEEFVLEAGEARMTGENPGEVIVFPPQATIQPGQTQTFRLQYVGDPTLTKSKHYYVTVAEVPVKTDASASGVHVVFNFQVLVSVGQPGARSGDDYVV